MVDEIALINHRLACEEIKLLNVLKDMNDRINIVEDKLNDLSTKIIQIEILIDNIDIKICDINNWRNKK
jgi:hypothetical protein